MDSRLNKLDIPAPTIGMRKDHSLESVIYPTSPAPVPDLGSSNNLQSTRAVDVAPTERPKTLTVQPDRIPLALRELPQWVNAKPGTKIPINPKTGRHASTTDPANWGAFTAAHRRANRDGSKIGFVFSADDDLHGLDLDKCRDPNTGHVEPWAQEIVDAYPTYWEISTSGSGLHGIGRGSLPPGGNTKAMPNGGKIEMYDRGRHFITTGDHLTGTSATIQDTQDALNILHGHIFPPAPPQRFTAPLSTTGLDDSELIERMTTSANGPHIQALWAGNTDGYDGDDSRADLALCGHLMFWTGNDKVRADRLFRQSALYREKWDRADYRERTLEKAMQKEVYSTRRPLRLVTPARDLGPETGEVRERRHLTDLGNAERLQDAFGDRIRHCHAFSTWLIWNGVRWEPDATGQINRFMAETVRGTYAEAADGATIQEREAIAKHAARSEAAARIEAAISLARSLDGISIPAEALDTDRWALNCLNGTLKLRTGELREHDPADMMTKVSPVEYDPEATLPLWDRFLDETTGGDKDFADFLRRAAGYTLVGEPIEEVMFFPHGDGGGGKSTFLTAFANTLGDYALTADFETFLKKRGDGGIRSDIARLDGARLVQSIEVDDGKKLAEGLVKTITGGDTVTARELYKKAVQYRPAFTLWLAANHAPSVKPDDVAMWRRILRLPFTNILPKEKQDPKVKAALRDPTIAGPAILAWAVRGCLEWQRDGLAVPTIIERATEEYRREMNPFADFFDACCDLSPQAFTANEALWGAYRQYTEAEGISTAATRAECVEQLKTLHCTSGTQRRGPKVKRGWHGIALKDDDTPRGDALDLDACNDNEHVRQGDEEPKQPSVTLQPKPQSSVTLQPKPQSTEGEPLLHPDTCNVCNSPSLNFSHESLHVEKLHNVPLQTLQPLQPSPPPPKAASDDALWQWIADVDSGHEEEVPDAVRQCAQRHGFTFDSFGDVRLEAARLAAQLVKEATR